MSATQEIGKYTEWYRAEILDKKRRKESYGLLSLDFISDVMMICKSLFTNIQSIDPTGKYSLRKEEGSYDCDTGGTLTHWY